MSLEQLTQEFRNLQASERDLVNALSCAGDLLTDLSSVPESEKERFETFAAGYLSVIQKTQDKLLKTAESLAHLIPEGRNIYTINIEEYATLLTVQALEQRLAINRAALKEDAASQEGGEGNPEPMQEA